jgi:hypothetical protein
MGPKVSVWLLASSTALIWVQGVRLLGLFRVEETRMLAVAGSWSGAVIAGLMFGAAAGRGLRDRGGGDGRVDLRGDGLACPVQHVGRRGSHGLAGGSGGPAAAGSRVKSVHGGQKLKVTLFQCLDDFHSSFVNHVPTSRKLSIQGLARYAQIGGEGLHPARRRQFVAPAQPSVQSVGHAAQ